MSLSECGQRITSAVLTSNLDCRSASGFAVTIADGGKLDLDGYRLTGTADYGTVEDPHFGGGVDCEGDCTIVGGGGSIVAPAGLSESIPFSVGVHHEQRRSVGVVVVIETTLSGWPGAAIVGRILVLNDTVITDNAYGVKSSRFVLMEGSSIVDNGVDGVHSRNGMIATSTINGNGNVGIDVVRRMKLFGTVVSGNHSGGFRGGRLIAKDSLLRDNCSAPATGTCADIIAKPMQRPLLDNSPCGTSWNEARQVSWKVCEHD